MKPKNYFLCAVIMMATMCMLQAQNTTLPVGAIPGTIDVSHVGMATYTIPIEVVPGTQGIQPNLSIVYNSMSGMGLLGMKWNLAGLSAITRCGQTPYYDNKIKEISFYRYPPHAYTLDSERLIMLETINENGVQYEFATEAENFMRIYSHGYTDGKWNVPIYFKAYTNDGSIIEYGNTTNSKQKLGTSDNILSWHINKITNVHGNYMTYNYGNSNNEIWVQSIQYTGNGSTQPYAKVEFSYTTLPDTMGRNTYFVGGYEVSQTKILSQISISYGNTIVRKYQFNYNQNDAGERTMHLKNIVLVGENNVQLNATTVTWDSKNISIASKPVSGLPSGKILTGDFNGDGFADILLYNTELNGKGLKLYLYNPATNSYPSGSSPSYSNSSITYVSGLLYAQDINGDGLDELFIGEQKHSSTLGNYLKFTVYKIGNNTLQQIFTKDCYNSFDKLIFGDFDGDGITDMLFSTYTVEESFWGDKYNRIFLALKFDNKSSDKFTHLGTIQSDHYLGKLAVLDLNGNGKQNIEVTNNTNASNITTKIYEFNGGSFSIISNDLQPCTYSYRWYGDVNGDGISDLLVYCYENSKRKWKIFAGKGDNNTFVNCDISNALDTNSLTNNNYVPANRPLLIDLNGDGKADIIQGVYNQSTNTTTLTILLSKGWINGVYKYTKHTHTITGKYNYQESWHFGDFENKGRIGILLKDSVTSSDPPKIRYFNLNTDYEFVKEIKDGIGKKIELNYKHQYCIAKSRHYDPNGYAISSLIKCFLSTVESLKVSNGIGSDVNTLLYKYYTPAYSLPRRTFLGFNEFVCINNLENTRDSLYCNLEPLTIYNHPLQILFPRRQISYIDNQMVSEKYITSVKVIDEANKRFAYYGGGTLDDWVSNTKIQTINTLTDHGRLLNSVTNTYDLTSNQNTLVQTKTTTFYYQKICIPEPQRINVPTTVVTKEKYGSNGTEITETTTYAYSSIGDLTSTTKTNLHGAITNTYEYTPTGLCKKKTVSAQGVTSRSENFTFDATSRFISTATNPLEHTATMTYDPKTGNKLTETDANQLTTTYTYDGLGNLKFVTYPDNTKDTLTVHWKTNLSTFPVNAQYFTKARSTGKGELRVYYDILGRELCRWSDGYYFDTRYNEKGQVVKTSYPYSDSLKNDNQKIWNSYTYDTYGRKQTETAPYTNISYSYNNRKVTVTDHGVSSYKDYDALGRIIEAEDVGGIITYNYTITSDKLHQTTITTNGATTTIISDLWGNRLSITEPNAGTITSEYNKFNELINQTDAKGNITIYDYDEIGRIIEKAFYKQGGPMPLYPSIFYTYDTGNKAKGKLSQIDMGGSIAEKFTYDNLGRLSSHTKYNDGTQKFGYFYNSNSQLQKLTYPGGFAVNYTYTSTGKLQEIRRNSDNSLIYKVNFWNEFNQPIEFTHGNGLITSNNYNPYGRITDIYIGERPDIVLSYYYDYDTKGLMTTRDDYVVQNFETFTYDNLDRLTQTNISGQSPQTLTYHNNGNILTNSLVGNYSYTSSQPHAVRTILQNSNAPIPSDSCAVTYNLFNQPTKITEGDYRIDLSYGANQQRNKTVFKQNDTVVSTRYYFNKRYEKEVNSAGETLHYNYIYGPTGVVALQIGDGYANNDTAVIIDDGIGIGDGVILSSITPTIDNMYYIHTDHLGSYIALTDENKNVVQRNTFDPWGNYQSFNTTDFPITTRGFTGHEHYPFFKIINMNGRLYDPVIGRFFSPDKYVANSSFTQDFNRYSYARNNPLMYTDPSGHKLKGWQWALIGLGIDVVSGGFFSSSALLTAGAATTTVAQLAITPSLRIPTNGYELQKYISPIAIKFGANFGSDGANTGVDISLGMPTMFGLGYRFHCGASYGEWNLMKGYYKGWETRIGGEWQLPLGISFSGTKFGGKWDQTTHKLSILGVSYENDYMFGLNMPGVPKSDNGDRWRTAALEIKFGPSSLNLNMFTGDPDTFVRGDRYDNVEIIDEHETYTGIHANDYRNAVLSFNFGPFRIGGNSENNVRCVFQNKVAHDKIMKGESKWFEVLPLRDRFYWYFGWGSGDTLW